SCGVLVAVPDPDDELARVCVVRVDVDPAGEVVPLLPRSADQELYHVAVHDIPVPFRALVPTYLIGINGDRIVGPDPELPHGETRDVELIHVLSRVDDPVGGYAFRHLDGPNVPDGVQRAGHV